MLAPLLILASTGLTLPSTAYTVSSSSNTELGPAALAEDFSKHPFSLELRLGVATPTGGIGLAAEYSLLPEFALGCGIGTNGLSAEPACWLRARALVERRFALTLSSGFSTAEFVQNEVTQDGVFAIGTAALHQMGEGPGPDSRNFSRADWLNSDIGFEVRNDAVVFRGFAGAAALLNPNDGVVEKTGHSDEVPADPVLQALVYLGFGIGVAP